MKPDRSNSLYAIINHCKKLMKNDKIILKNFNLRSTVF